MGCELRETRPALSVQCHAVEPAPPVTDAPTIRLFSYKMTHDSGFAPNPFQGVCTLATCKADLRRTKRVGDWIAGFTSKHLNADRVGEERLVYLMQITEKVPFETYHTDRRFAAKIPMPASKRCIETVGDNIYGRRDGAIFQIPNAFHTPHDIVEDTNGCFVLIGGLFAYFGSVPLIIHDEIRPMMPTGVSRYGVQTDDLARAQAFIDFVLAQGTGVHDRRKLADR